MGREREGIGKRKNIGGIYGMGGAVGLKNFVLIWGGVAGGGGITQTP
jgi:hypothetical protein